MKNRIIFSRNLLSLIVIVLFTSCQLFDKKDKQAIEICQQAKVQLSTENVFSNIALTAMGLGADATWLDFANMVAKRESNKKFNWHGKKTEDGEFYIVDFIDKEGWGHRWEVDIEQKIVKNINQNDYLSRKYGYRRFDNNLDFLVTKIENNELKLENNYNDFEICYLIKASVLNKTNKTIISATIDGELKLIFKEKNINGKGNYESGFKSKISNSNPWEPNTTKDFYIKTKGIEKIYLNYSPEYIVFSISLQAEDPVGYSFDKDITDMDLKENWESFKTTTTGNTSFKKTENTSLSIETYCNERFDYCIEYPSNILFPEPESPNSDGKIFKNIQGEKALIVYGQFNIDSDGNAISLEDQFNKETLKSNQQNEKREITYKRLMKTYFVISGYSDGKFFIKKQLRRAIHLHMPHLNTPRAIELYMINFQNLFLNLLNNHNDSTRHLHWLSFV